MYKLRIKGKNIERFIKRLNTNKINLYKIEHIKYDEINIIINKEDLTRILELKSIYDVKIIKKLKSEKIRSEIHKNKFLFLALIIGLAIIYTLSNIIFNIEVVHNDPNIRKLLINELENYGINKYKFKKSFKSVEKIKSSILKDHKDKIEWLEIEAIGTKYIIRVEERKLPSKENVKPKRHVTAKKDAILKRITASEGQIIRSEEQYVRAGDIIISGDVTLNEEKKGSVSADGVVYGEVWYQVKVEYPYYYYEEKYTNNKNTALVLTFLNNEFEIFKKFNNKKTEEKILFNGYLFPFKISIQKQKEIKVIESIYTEQEAIAKALELGRSKIKNTLKNKEHIINEKDLKVNVKDSKIEVDIFYAVYEDITDYQTIIEEG